MTRTRTHSIRPDFTVYEVASKNAQVFSDRIAVAEDKDRLTFKQLLELMRCLTLPTYMHKDGVHLQKNGVRKTIQ